jgi:MOSC domain-containing protein YiiM
MTTYDPDTQTQDLGVLRDIVSRFGGRLALDCFVIRGGEIAVGQPVELVERDRPAPAMSHAGAAGI